MQLGTFTYRYDTEKYFHMNLPEDDQIGLIANDVAQLYPHLTKKVVQPAQRIPLEDAIDWLGEGGNYTVDDDDEEMAIVGEEVTFEGVNYAGMVPVLIQAIKEQQQVNDNGFLTWTMTLEHPKLQKGKTICVNGVSHLKFRDGQVIYHRDYFDLGEMLYENLPLLGSVIKAIKQRLGS